MSELRIRHNYCYVLRGAVHMLERACQTEAFFRDTSYAHFIMVHSDTALQLLEDWTAAVHAHEPNSVSWSLRVIFWEKYLWIVCSVQKSAMSRFMTCVEVTGQQAYSRRPRVQTRDGGVRFPFWSNSAYTLAPASLIA